MKRLDSVVWVVAVGVLAACGGDSGSGNNGGLSDVGNGSGDADDASGADDVVADVVDDGADDDADDVADSGLDAVADAGGDDTALDVADEVADPDVSEPDIGTDTGSAGAVDPYADGPARIEEIGVTVPLSDDSTAPAVVFVPEYRADGPFPFVVLSHGFQLQGSQFHSYARRLATHGIAVIVPNYGDSALAPRTHVELANDVVSTIDWALAQSASAGAFEGSFDAERIGVAGHSRGGKQSIFAATLDDRIDAVFGLDPVDSGPPVGNNAVDFPSVTPELMGNLTVPSGYVGTGRGSGGIIPCAPSGDNYSQYFANSPSPSYSWLISDGGHNDFTDSCEGLLLAAICRACTAGEDPDFSRTFGRATMLAFFEVHLRGDDRYEPWLNGAAVTTLEGTGVIEFDER